MYFNISSNGINFSTSTHRFHPVMHVLSIHSEDEQRKWASHKNTTVKWASWARTWRESHHVQLPWHRVEVEHCWESLQSSRPHWLSRYV